MRNGDCMPRALSASTTGELAPSALNDCWEMLITPSTDGSRPTQPETIKGVREAQSHGPAKRRPSVHKVAERQKKPCIWAAERLRHPVRLAGHVLEPAVDGERDDHGLGAEPFRDPECADDVGSRRDAGEDAFFSAEAPRHLDGL